jgi:hypothetical protein
MARSRTSDEAYEDFKQNNASEVARISCFQAALHLLQRNINDPRTTEPEIADQVHDTSRAVAKRLTELAALGYFVMAGEKKSILNSGKIGPLANAWTTPELYGSLPAEYRVPHVRIGVDVLSPGQVLSRLMQNLRLICAQAQVALGNNEEDLETAFAMSQAALEGILENITEQIRLATERTPDQPEAPSNGQA